MLYICIFLFSVFISAISQIILKTSANQKHENWIKDYLNVKVIVAYSIFFISSFITIFAYKEVPFSIGPMLEATGYIWVAVLGYIFLKERISIKKIIGLVLIVVGIIIANIQL